MVPTGGSGGLKNQIRCTSRYRNPNHITKMTMMLFEMSVNPCSASLEKTVAHLYSVLVDTKKKSTAELCLWNQCSYHMVLNKT